MRLLRLNPSVLAAGLLFAGMAAHAAATAVPPPDAKAGDTLRYQFAAKLNVSGSNVELRQVLKQIVREITDGGELVLSEESETGEITIMGDRQELPAGPGVTATLNRQGRVIKFAYQGDETVLSARANELITLFSQLVYPMGPVEVGAEWPTEYANPLASGKKVSITTAYLGSEKVEGRDLLKLRQTAEAEDGAGGRVRGTFTFWIDPEAPSQGYPVKIESDLRNVPTSFGPMDSASTHTLLGVERR
jgi:hypothetical protein